MAKRSKKKKPEPSAPLPGEGTAEGEMLREANAAFEAGNYARVRELAPLLAKAPDPKVVDAAADLSRRVAVDPVQIGFLVACAIALSIIAWIYLS